MKKLLKVILPVLVFLVLMIVLQQMLREKPEEFFLPPPVPQVKYGIVIDSLILYSHTILRNEHLSDILLSYGVDYPTVDKLVRLSNPVFDVRRLRTSNRYTIMCSNDSSHKAKYMVYEDTPTSYVVFSLADTLSVYRGTKDLQRVIRFAEGSIQSSLWNAMVASRTDPSLAIELSDIYAWTIDFFGIQKGDTYRVIYEQLVVEKDTIGIGNVIAASFANAGHTFYAFRFEQDSVADYYDEKAKSLRRTFLKAPLRYSRISSRYSHSRYHPVLKIRRPHHGVDYAAPAGTPVQTIGDGVVIKTGYEKGGGGRYIKIKHNSVYTTVYMHLQGYARGFREGMRVKQGDVIGYVGSSGLATGPHLDFRVYKNGSPVDPLKVESPPAEPVKEMYRPEYDSLIKGYIERLR